MRDWEEIRKAFAEDGESLRSVSKRFSIPYSTVQQRAAKESWGADAPRRKKRALKKSEFERVGQKLLERIERCLDEGREVDLKEIKAVTGALKELQTLREEPAGGHGGGRTLTVRFEGEAEEMSK